MGETTFNPSPLEEERAREVWAALVAAIDSGAAILLPSAGCSERFRSETALQHVGIEPNDFGGTVGSYRYQFEGEDDLLHLFVVRQDGSEFGAHEAQAVAEWLLGDLPKGLLWYKPGRLTHHFYVGHEDLRRSTVR